MYSPLSHTNLPADKKYSEKWDGSEIGPGNTRESVLWRGKFVGTAELVSLFYKATQKRNFRR